MAQIGQPERTTALRDAAFEPAAIPMDPLWLIFDVLLALPWPPCVPGDADNILSIEVVLKVRRVA